MAGRITIPQRSTVHILIPGICEYLTLHGKKGFADSIKLRPNVIISVLKSGRGMQKKRIRGRCDYERWSKRGNADAVKMEEAATSQRMCILQKLERTRKQIFLQSLQKERQRPAKTSFLAQWDLCWTSDLQSYKIIDLCYISH